MTYYSLGNALLLLGLVWLAGCTGTPGTPTLEPVEPVTARLALEGFNYENKLCDDDVPVAITVHNVGTIEARNVSINTRGGYEDYSGQLGTMSPGAIVTVHANIKARDKCGNDDDYTIVITARPENGPEVTVTQAIEI